MSGARRSACRTLLPTAAALVLLGCTDPAAYLQHDFPGPPVPSEVMATLDEMPSGLRILDDGRWAVGPVEGGAPSYPVNGDMLLVPVADGRFQARVEEVRRDSTGPRVTQSAGELVAAVAHSGTRPGTGLVAVRLGSGWTRTIASWDMSEDDGFLDAEEMVLSPDGRRLALQLVEKHPRRSGFRTVGRRGVIVPMDEEAGEPADLGPEIIGPMAWTADGTMLYFLRPARGSQVTLLRVSLSPPGPATERIAGAAPAAGPGLPAGEEGAATAPAPTQPAPTPVAFSQEDLIATIVRLSSNDVGDRLQAASEIARMPDPMAVGPLLTAMEKGDAALCLAADRSLRSLLDRPDPAPLADSAPATCAAGARAWRAWWKEHPRSLRR